ncbi:NAD(P)-dependent oxidoreductase [Streptomyces sp. NBC_00887]|uniref:NAD(P)-dependent oxidoreductase n=1 Tax=Streptomyces sp. NBC_00887 TaxID=2975859 RepID=UPI00386ACBFF|nr:NAD(P)-binding domain-containing protein [Streptomyces sp. NBC_00887]
MDTHTTPRTSVTLLGLGDMGTALARAWLTAGHPLTVWNRTPEKAGPLAGEGARVAATPAEAVASATGPVILCLLDDASVEEALDGVDLTGKDVVDLTTSTPAGARRRARRTEERGARFLDGGIMAVPPMIGRPETGGYILYSGDRALFERHRGALEAPAGVKFVGEDPGHAALHDIALLSAMTGMLAGVTHAFALVGAEKDLDRAGFAALLADWLGAMSGTTHEMAAQLESGDYTEGVTSNLAMMAAGNDALLATAEGQSVDPRLLTPYMELMRRRVAQGHGDEGLAGMVGLLRGE